MTPPIFLLVFVTEEGPEVHPYRNEQARCQALIDEALEAIGDNPPLSDHLAGCILDHNLPLTLRADAAELWIDEHVSKWQVYRRQITL